MLVRSLTIAFANILGACAYISHQCEPGLNGLLYNDNNRNTNRKKNKISSFLHYFAAIAEFTVGG